jgi:hypothetical protein
MSDLWLFVLAIAKVVLLCGWPAIAIVFVRTKVSRRAVSRNTSAALSDGNKPASEVLARAA